MLSQLTNLLGLGPAPKTMDAQKGESIAFDFASAFADADADPQSLPAEPVVETGDTDEVVVASDLDDLDLTVLDDPKAQEDVSELPTNPAAKATSEDMADDLSGAVSAMPDQEVSGEQPELVMFSQIAEIPKRDAHTLAKVVDVDVQTVQGAKIFESVQQPKSQSGDLLNRTNPKPDKVAGSAIVAAQVPIPKLAVSASYLHNNLAAIQTEQPLTKPEIQPTDVVPRPAPKDSAVKVDVPKRALAVRQDIGLADKTSVAPSLLSEKNQMIRSPSSGPQAVATVLPEVQNNASVIDGVSLKKAPFDGLPRPEKAENRSAAKVDMPIFRLQNSILTRNKPVVAHAKAQTPTVQSNVAPVVLPVEAAMRASNIETPHGSIPAEPAITKVPEPVADQAIRPPLIDPTVKSVVAQPLVREPQVVVVSKGEQNRKTGTAKSDLASSGPILATPKPQPLQVPVLENGVQPMDRSETAIRNDLSVPVTAAKPSLKDLNTPPVATADVSKPMGEMPMPETKVSVERSLVGAPLPIEKGAAVSNVQKPALFLNVAITQRMPSAEQSEAPQKPVVMDQIGIRQTTVPSGTIVPPAVQQAPSLVPLADQILGKSMPRREDVPRVEVQTSQPGQTPFATTASTNLAVVRPAIVPTSAPPPIVGRVTSPLLADVVEDVTEAEFQTVSSGQDARLPGSAPASSSVTMSRPDVAPVLRQLAEGMGRLADGTVEIRLSPEELGHVRMQLITGETGLTVHITADRPDTLDLMRRHIDQLARDLADAGYGDAAFSFGEDGDKGSPSQNRSDARADDPMDTPAPQPGTMMPISDGLDLRM